MPYEHPCHCGKPGGWGYNGVWTCFEHRPEGVFYDQQESARAERNEAARAERAGGEGSGNPTPGIRRQAENQIREQGDARAGEGVQQAWVTLAAPHIQFVDNIAEQLTRLRTDIDDGIPRSFDERFTLSRDGFRAEAAARLWFGRGVPWSILDKEPGKPDFAGFIDARGRTKQGHCLRVEKYNEPARAYLLICGALHPRYRIVGWCWGHEAMIEQYWHSFVKGRWAYWVHESAPIIKAPELLKGEIEKRGIYKNDSRT